MAPYSALETALKWLKKGSAPEIFRRLQAALLFLAALGIFAALPLASIFLPSNHASPFCQGDHLLCGCDPEKVAAGLCCCVSPLPECCKVDAADGATPVYKNPSCGAGKNVALSSVDTTDLALSSPGPLPGPSWFYPESVKESSAPAFTIERPPVPPPRRTV